MRPTAAARLSDPRRACSAPPADRVAQRRLTGAVERHVNVARANGNEQSHGAGQQGRDLLDGERPQELAAAGV